MVDFGKLALGGGLILGGVGVGYVAKSFLPEKWKPAGYIGAIGIAGLGCYQIYKSFREGEVPTPDLVFTVYITDPTPGEKWSVILPHTVNVDVANPYDTDYKLYGGMSMIKDYTGEIWDAPIIPFIVPKEAGNRLKWWWWGSPGGLGTGLYWVVVSVWDQYPKGDCEIQGTCHRLGEAESNVEFGYFTPG